MSRSVLRPMGIGEILDAAFGLYRRHFVDLVKLGGIFFGFVFLVALVDPGIAYAAQIVFVLVATIALMKRASGHIVEEPTTYGQCVRLGFRKWFPVFAASILVSMLTGLGFLLFVVPGVLLTAVWFAWMPVMVLEDDWGFPSRSTKLAQGAWVKILIVKLVSLIILIGPGAVLGAVEASADPTQAASLSEAMVPSRLLMLGSLVIGLLTTPFSVLVDLMLYYERRVAVEGFDVELATRDLSDVDVDVATTA